MPLFEYKQVDKEYYENVIKDFLPDHIIDAHTHVYLDEMRDPSYVEPPDNRSPQWPNLVATDNSIEDLKETYQLMFPCKQVTPVIFGMPNYKYDMQKNNDYILRCSKDADYPALMLAHPEHTAQEIEAGLSRGYKGVKVYLEFAPSYIPGHEIRIFDFTPHHQLEVFNEFGAALMLHIPRPGRIKDPVNLAEMLEIDRRYPKVKLIIAHVGRAYAMEDLGNAFDLLKDSNMIFDISANTNQEVFEQTLLKIGPERIIFGSDLPITRMRMKRIVENGKYINIVKKGSYGDVSQESNMREIDGAESEALSFFMYEIISAMKRACETQKISREDVNAIFFDNASKLFNIKK